MGILLSARMMNMTSTVFRDMRLEVIRVWLIGPGRPISYKKSYVYNYMYV